MLDEPILLTDLSDVGQRFARKGGQAAARNHPGGEVRRSEAAADVNVAVSLIEEVVRASWGVTRKAAA
nr:hypothetical protein [uncultured Sphingomonas sp.]